MGEEQCVGGDPVGVLPVPFGIGAADEFSQIGAPGCEVDVAGCGGGRIDWDGEVMIFDNGRRVGELDLVELVAVPAEEVGEALASIGKVGGDDGDVFDHGEIPGRHDGEGGIVQADFEGEERGESEWWTGVASEGFFEVVDVHVAKSELEVF